MCCVLCRAFSFVRPSSSLQGGPGRRGTRRSWKRALCPRRCGKGPRSLLLRLACRDMTLELPPPTRGQPGRGPRCCPGGRGCRSTGAQSRALLPRTALHLNSTTAEASSSPDHPNCCAPQLPSPPSSIEAPRIADPQGRETMGAGSPPGFLLLVLCIS